MYIWSKIAFMISGDISFFFFISDVLSHHYLHRIIISKHTHSPHTISTVPHVMSNVTSSYEVGLFSLIGCRFQFGVNRFEKEYLRKCAFWQRLQAGMYVAHVSLEIDIESLGSPLECTPLLLPPLLHANPATRLMILQEAASATCKGKYSCNITAPVNLNRNTLLFADIHSHKHTKIK